MKKLLLGIGFICCLYLLKAQQPSHYFTRITSQNGLSHNKVNCIIRDQQGFMWMGTDDGLNRYDGNKFTVYRNKPGDQTTISGNIITDLLEDEAGILWIATADGGLTKYNRRLPPQQQFKQYRHLPSDSTSIPVNIINKIVQDPYGYLWLATSGHYVLRFNKKTERFQVPVPIGTKTALALTMGGDGMLWVGRQGGGLLKINPQTLQYQMDQRYNDLYAKLPYTTVPSLFTDRQKNTWFGSWDKLIYKYNAATKLEERMDSSQIMEEALSFAEDHAGNIWIGGRYNGLHIYNPKAQQYDHFPHDPSREGTIASNRINCLYIDPAGIVWIGTNKGVSISNPLLQQFKQTFLPRKTKETIVIHDFYKDEHNDLWIGTSAGIFLQRSGSHSFEHYPIRFKGESLIVSKFFKDTKGNHYLGTNYSLFRFDPVTLSISLLPNTEKDGVMNQIIKSQVVSIVEDQIDDHRVLMVSPYGHFITYYDFVEMKWVSRLDSTKNIIRRHNIKDNLVRRIYKTKAGDIWMATAKEGLGKWAHHSTPALQFFKNDPSKMDGLSNNHVYDIAEDRNGHLWLSTFGGGLHYFNTKDETVTHIEEGHNLLEGLQVDNMNNVWMVGNGNLHKYDPVTKSHSSFQLPDIEKSGGVQGRIYKDATGKLYVAGSNYFIAFQPESIRVSQHQPSVYFTDFRIFNESYSHFLNEKKITLCYNENYITIEFSAPDYASGSPVNYQYMLQGFDKKWVDLNSENKVSFSNLDGGTYTFRVRATNKPGVWSEAMTELQFVIHPPFWKRWWFFLLCACFAAGIAYALYRYRINELLKRQAIRNKIAQDLHDNVGSTLSSISIYSQVAKIYKEQQKEQQLQETLEKISDTSSEMISEMNDIVWAINPRNDHMDVMLQRMQSYAKPLLASKDIKLSFVYDPAVQLLNLEMTKRKNFYLIFKEAINNVLKYAQCKNLEVAIKIQQHHLEMKVTDDGVGFDWSAMKAKASQSLSGNGLRNMHIRTKEMKGNFSVESTPGIGTTVCLRFPIP
jgi:ligand-binding sensor domain-containing protein/two-component sensor histidine kinase